MYVRIPTKKESKNFDYIFPIRRHLFKEILGLLDEAGKEIYFLYNLSVVGTDRLVDYGIHEAKFFLERRELMIKSWEKEKLQSEDEHEASIIELVQKLRKLYDDGLFFAKSVYESLLDNFENNYKDASRRWKILSAKNLDELRIAVTQPYFSGLLHLLIPEIKRDHALKVSTDYSLPTKIADDLADFHEDVPLGFINVPKEEIDNLSGILIEGDRVTEVYENELKLEDSYISAKIKDAEEIYKNADESLEKILLDYPQHETALKLFKKLCYSWLEEAKEKYF